MLQKTFSGQLGRRTKSLVDKFFTSKMPGGFNLTKVRDMLEQEYGFAAGRQDSILLFSLQTQPAARFDSEEKAKGYWSSIVQTYIATTGIEIRKSATTSGTAVDARIDDRFAIHRKQKSVSVQRLFVRIARIGQLVTHPLAQIFDDVGASADSPQRKYAVTVNARVANLKERRCWAPRGLLHTAMGALIAA